MQLEKEDDYNKGYSYLALGLNLSADALHAGLVNILTKKKRYDAALQIASKFKVRFSGKETFAHVLIY